MSSILGWLIGTLIAWFTLTVITPRLTKDVTLTGSTGWSFISALNYVAFQSILLALLGLIPGVAAIAMGSPILLIALNVLSGSASLMLISRVFSSSGLQVKSFAGSLIASAAITIVTVLLVMLLSAL